MLLNGAAKIEETAFAVAVASFLGVPSPLLCLRTAPQRRS
jgi:hypothetical protein